MTRSPHPRPAPPEEVEGNQNAFRWYGVRRGIGHDDGQVWWVLDGDCCSGQPVVILGGFLITEEAMLPWLIGFVSIRAVKRMSFQ